jgi:hypothetical protein
MKPHLSPKVREALISLNQYLREESTRTAYRNELLSKVRGLWVEDPVFRAELRKLRKNQGTKDTQGKKGKVDLEFVELCLSHMPELGVDREGILLFCAWKMGVELESIIRALQRKESRIKRRT